MFPRKNLSKERRKPRKRTHKPKPIKRRPDAPPPDPQDEGYDGYYDDTPTLDDGAFKEKLDKGLIKQIIVVGASAIVIVVLAIVLMKLL